MTSHIQTLQLTDSEKLWLNELYEAFKKEIHLTVLEELWLTELYEFYKKEIYLTPLKLKRKLWPKLDEDFDPYKMDRRLIRHGCQLTPLGIFYLDSESNILERINSVMKGLQNLVHKNFRDDRISMKVVLDELSISEKDLFRTLELIKQSIAGSFQYTWDELYSADSKEKEKALLFQSDAAIEEILNYKGIEKFVAEKILNPEEKNPKQKLSTIPEGERIERIRKGVVFIIMAMDPSKPELEDIHGAIKEVCKSFDLRALRADDIEHQERITDIILQNIKECQFVIADLTHERPNVYYEIGFAHALDKRPILYRKQGTPLHFDLLTHNVPEYKNITEFKKLLTKRFEAILGRVAKTEKLDSTQLS